MKNRFLILAMVAGVGLTIQLSALLPLNGASPKSIFAYLAVTPTQKGKTIW